jgi:steroid delta-isomerase-like uncharacterized protein
MKAVTMRESGEAAKTEINKALYQSFIHEVFNEGRLESLSTLLSKSYVLQDAPSETVSGADGVKQAVRLFRTAFPDMRITIEELIAEGDAVCARSVLRGTHQGEFMGIPATGRTIAMATLTLVHIIDGRLTSSCVKNDVVTLLHQLGAWPPPKK